MRVCHVLFLCCLSLVLGAIPIPLSASRPWLLSAAPSVVYHTLYLFLHSCTLYLLRTSAPHEH